MQKEWDMRIAVVDDTPSDRDRTLELTKQVLEAQAVCHSIRVFPNARSLIEDIQRGGSYNVLLLDVLMEEMDGVELAQELRREGNHAGIIFVSSSREMAWRGYRVDAIRYLLKPLDRGELTEALECCIKHWKLKKEILLPTAHGQYRTAFPKIQYVEAFERGTRFVLTDETVETRLKFSEAEAMLPKEMFAVCHRAYIVNLALTKRISQYEFLMKSGEVVPISRYRYNDINRQFVSYITD